MNSPRVSPTAVKAFAAYSRLFIRRRFHSIRILKGGLPLDTPGRPLVIYLNHASWWDPLLCLLLSRAYFPERVSYAPIDAGMLERYAFFKRLGFFGVGAARNFLRTTLAILDSESGAVWITPQGRFADVRERPLRMQAGLAAIAERAPDAVFLPLAIEYAFWTEPQPEILVSFGEPGELGGALERTQDSLAAASCRRDPGEWLVLDRGASGVNAIYDAWRWLRSRAGGEHFMREHGTGATR